MSRIKNTPKDRCNEIVARKPIVLRDDGRGGDYTHLQFCGAPVYKWHLCERHFNAPNRALPSRWRRFLRIGGAA